MAMPFTLKVFAIKQKIKTKNKREKDERKKPNPEQLSTTENDFLCGPVEYYFNLLLHLKLCVCERMNSKLQTKRQLKEFSACVLV